MTGTVHYLHPNSELHTSPTPAPLQHGGGDGTSGGMSELDKRVTILEGGVKRLEEDMKDIKSDLKGMRADIASMNANLSEVKGRVASLPTTLQLLGFVVAIFVAAGVLKYFGH